MNRINEIKSELFLVFSTSINSELEKIKNSNSMDELLQIQHNLSFDNDLNLDSELQKLCQKQGIDDFNFTAYTIFSDKYKFKRICEIIKFSFLNDINEMFKKEIEDKRQSLY